MARLVLALLLALASLSTVGTFAVSYFPAETDFNRSTFQTNALTGDPTGFSATGAIDSNAVNLSWIDAATTNFGNGDAELVQWSSASHTCPTTATSYTFVAGSVWAANSAHAPTDTVDPAGTTGKTPAGAYVCYGASVAYGQGAVTSWTAATPLWYGFAPGHPASASRYGEYVASISMSNAGTIKKTDTLTINYSQATNQPALGTGGLCAHYDTGSGMTIVFLGYVGATCNYTLATASTAPTQFGYTVQTGGTVGAFADETASLGVNWRSANQVVITISSKLSGAGNITDAGTSWDYHVSATAPAGAIQVTNLVGGELVAENASCPVATSTNAW